MKLELQRHVDMGPPAGPWFSAPETYINVTNLDMGSVWVTFVGELLPEAPTSPPGPLTQFYFRAASVLRLETVDG